MRENWVSPSDFAWLWDECPRCWWLKTTGSIYRPGADFGVARSVDGLMKDTFRPGNTLHHLGFPGTITGTNVKLQGKAREYPGGVLMRVNGFADIVGNMDSGGRFVLDAKFTGGRVDPEGAARMASKYSLQVNAYGYAWEDAEGAEVTDVGLLLMVPQTLTYPDNVQVVTEDGEVVTPFADVPVSAMTIGYQFVAADRSNSGVIQTLEAMADSLAAGYAPKKGKDCRHCGYVSRVLDYAKALKRGTFNDEASTKLLEGMGTNDKPNT